MPRDSQPVLGVYAHGEDVPGPGVITARNLVGHVGSDVPARIHALCHPVWQHTGRPPARRWPPPYALVSQPEPERVPPEAVVVQPGGLSPRGRQPPTFWRLQNVRVAGPASPAR